MTMRRAATGVALGLVVSCLPDVAYECRDDDACVLLEDGRCEADGSCSYPDPQCPSRRRYSRYARPGLASTCVDEVPAGGSTGPDDGLTAAAGSDGTTSGDAGTTDEGDGTTGAPPPDWAACDFAHRVRIGFAGEPGSTLEDFTVLVEIDHGGLPGAFAPGGADLRFLDDDGRTSLPYEIERFDPSGTSLVWVKVPRLTLGADDFVHLYWGDPDATPAADPEATWDTHHAAVWHLGEGVRDSTATGAHGSDDSLGPIDAAIGYGRRFTSDGRAVHRINVGSASALDDVFIAGGTVMAWVSLEAFPEPGLDARLLGKSASDPGHDGWKLVAVQESPYPGFPTRTLGFVRHGEGNFARWQASTSSLADDRVWRLVAVTWCDDPAACADACIDDCGGECGGDTPAARMFVDGEPMLTIEVQAPGSGILSDADHQLVLGNGPGGGEPLVGSLDEVRVSRTIRCDTWLHAEYLSMTGALVQMGEPESSPCADR